MPKINISSWISYFLAISSLFFCFNFLSVVQAQNLLNTDNEISITFERVRGGWEPLDFFDGHAIGVTYNRELFPYIMLHSEISFSRFLLTDDGEGDYASELHLNNMINSDFGMELIPVSIKRFQLRFGFGVSVQYRQSSDGMEPETKTGNQLGNKVYFFNFSTLHLGYKFELKTPVIVFRQFFLAPTATIRSYPKGKYDVPRSFELGIQGGYKF